MGCSANAGGTVGTVAAGSGAGGVNGAAPGEPASIRTFLFTDIEGSTRNWQAAPDGMAVALERHDGLLRDAVASHGGIVVKHTGDGILASFNTPRSAVAAAIEVQRKLLGLVPFAVRMAIAAGEARPREQDWFGPALNRCARLLDAGHGGQVLLTAATVALLQDLPLPDVSFVDLGEHRLRDLPDAQRIFQVASTGLAEHHPPLRTAAAPVHTIPAPRTRLVGRERELRELGELLERTRLLTITGVGGVGKTRLALELASRVLERHSGGTFFVELAVVADGPSVSRAVADAVGLERGGILVADTARNQVTSFLSRRDCLLVLDNCEHVVEECADLVDGLLDRCPGVTVVATSREPLAVDGEVVWRAPSMHTDGEEPEAVALFLERAAAARGGRLDDAEIERVTEICRRLDGIPLAIELAAAQAGRLATAEIAARLDDRFSLLTGGRRRVHRQQTLLAAVAWSHDLLAEHERVLLRRLAVFPAWFGSDAVEAVCGAGLGHVVPTLGSLVSKSLVITDERWRGKYRLLETIRLFAEDRLVDADEAEALRLRHRDWAFEEARRRSTTDTTLDSCELVGEIFDDVRTAMGFSVARGDLGAAARMLPHVGGFLFYSGRNDEALEWFDATDGADLTPAERADHVAHRASYLIVRGDMEEALRLAASVADIDPDPTSIGRLNADLYQALLLLLTDHRRAVELCDDIIRRASESPYYERMAREIRAHPMLVADPDAAIAEWEALLATADRTRRHLEDFYVLGDLGIAYHVVGRHDRSSDIADELDRRGFSVGRTHHAYAADFIRSLAHAGFARPMEARAFAARMWEAIRRSAVPLGDKDAALAFVAIAVAEGDVQSAAHLLGAVRGERSSAFFLRSPISYALYRHYSGLVRTRLPTELSARLYDAGRIADLATLVDQARSRAAARSG